VKEHIPFTQYMRPDGRTEQVDFECDDEAVALKADQIIAAGFRFECEVLTSNEVSLTISDGDDDLAGELCQNGPEVPIAIARLVLGFKEVAP
jgi:hypothetical protein